MSITNIDGIMLRKAIIAGANELIKNKELIDSLNVFPVPDGDTGTNMALTVLVVAREVSSLQTPNIYDVAKVASSGSLRGARGNSGVILSQLFRGFAKGLENKALMDANDLAFAFMKATEMAYKAVMKPKEGTILTVANAISKKAIESSNKTDDIEEMMREVLAYATKVLVSTTDMLIELKQAGVVDAGGKGLLSFLEGAFSSLNFYGEIKIEESVPNNAPRVYAAATDISNLEFGYCTEFFINIENIDNLLENKIRNYLQEIGDSIVVVQDEGIVKIHIHTEHPGSILEYALKLGSLSNLKIENMREQHSCLIDFSIKDNKTSNPKDKDIGFIAVASGDGFLEIFKELGVDVVVEGGQSMNPSADDILASINKINAKNIIILPNNKNVVLATKQAIEISKESGKNDIYCIPTKNLPQGISAMASYDPSVDFLENLQNMSDAISNVKTGQITLAVRNVTLSGKKIKTGDILCILEDEIHNVSDKVENGAKLLLADMLKDGGDLLGIYYGDDVSDEEATSILEYATKNYGDLEIEFKRGNQPLYHYLFSVE